MWNIYFVSSGTRRKAASAKSLLHNSVSSVASDSSADASAYIKPMPTHSHWLAMELLGIVECARSQLATDRTTMEFTVGTQKINIDKARLIQAHGSIEWACRMNVIAGKAQDTPQIGVLSEKRLASSELAFSALTTCLLDRFLFGGDNAHLGYCLHQGPTRKRSKATGSPEAADIYVCSCVGGGYGIPVAFGDLKLSDIDRATIETGLCCCSSVAVQTGQRKYPIYLGIPCTRSELALLVYMEEADGKMWQIPVYSGFPYCMELLCSLFCGVHFLIISNYFNRVPMVKPCPLFGKNLVPLTKQVDCRVYLEGTTRTVIKFFYLKNEPPQTLKPNYDLLKCLGIFRELDLVKIGNECHMLKYGYIDGDHEVKTLRQFSGAVRDLSKLHKAGFVHGDVRLRNIVFQKDTSQLIDYDLASEEFSKYPFSYVYEFPERHNDALPGWKMCKHHDIHSLLYLMKEVAKTRAEGAILKDVEETIELDLLAVKLETLEYRRRT